MESLLLSIPNLIDVAVGPTELNFKLLNMILQIIARQVGFETTRIQFTENTAVKMSDIATNRKGNKDLEFYSVEGSGSEEKLDLKKCKLQLIRREARKTVETLIIPREDTEMPAINITATHRPDMVATSLPTNSALVKAGQNNDGVLTQMCDILNITKRIESVELAVQKFNDLLSQLVRSSADLNTSKKSKSAKTCELSDADCLKIKEHIADFAMLKRIRSMMDRMDAFESQLVNLNSDENSDQLLKVWNLTKELETLYLNAKDRLDAAESQINQLNEKQNYADEENVSEQLAESSSTNTNRPAHSMVHHHTDCAHLETCITKTVTNMRLINGIIDELCELKKIFVLLTDDVSALTTRMGRAEKDGLDICARLEDYDVQFKNFNDDLNMLIQERLDRNRQFEALIEQVEHIKTTKANRAEMEIVLDTKANKTELWKKVPYEEFKALQKCLSLALIEALEKIVETDAGWRQAVEAIHLALKDKVEVSQALEMTADFMQRLEMLKDRIRGFAMFRLSCESAAVAQKYLPDVKCIACNAQTYINPDINLPPIPRYGGVSGGGGGDICCTKEMKKFSKITVPCSKNLAIGTTETVNRYCGGKHTSTTSTQWFSHVGNFIEQTGAVPLGANDTVCYAPGSDGVLYRIDPTDCSCTGKSKQ